MHRRYGDQRSIQTWDDREEVQTRELDKNHVVKFNQSVGSEISVADRSGGGGNEIEGRNVDVERFHFFRQHSDVGWVSVNPTVWVIFHTGDIVVQLVAISNQNPATRKQMQRQHKLENCKNDDLEVGLWVLLFENCFKLEDILYLTQGLWNLNVP